MTNTQPFCCHVEAEERIPELTMALNDHGWKKVIATLSDIAIQCADETSGITLNDVPYKTAGAMLVEVANSESVAAIDKMENREG